MSNDQTKAEERGDKCPCPENVEKAIRERQADDAEYIEKTVRERQTKEEERGDKCPCPECPEDIEGFVRELSNQQKWAFCRALLKHHTGPMAGMFQNTTKALRALREAAILPPMGEREMSGELRLDAMDMLKEVTQQTAMLTVKVSELLAWTAEGAMKLAGLGTEQKTDKQS